MFSYIIGTAIVWIALIHMISADQEIDRLRSNNQILAQELIDGLTEESKARLFSGVADRVLKDSYLIAREILKEKPDESL